MLDTRELGRRPGSMRELRLRVPAPADLGIVDLVGVPAGAELDLGVRLESVMEGVLVTATVVAPVRGECGRCLEPVEQTLRVRLQELYGHEPGPDPDEPESLLVGDLLDLEPALRDAVVLALPLTPLCRQDCAGLCAECGERLDELPGDHAHPTGDPRWSQLTALLRPQPVPYTQE